MIKIPTIMPIIEGIDTTVSKINIPPDIKSTQLAKSFSNPREALAKRIIPNIRKTLLERLALNIKINPAIISIIPNAFNNIIFK